MAFLRNTTRKVIAPETMQLIEAWCAQLPPVISRKRLDWFLGGIVSRKNIANLDSAGEGPQGRILVGRETVYNTHDLLVWLAQTRGFKKLTGLRTLEGMVPCAEQELQQRP